VILRLTSTLTADIGDEVGDDASEGRGQRAPHLHRFNDGEALACFDLLALAGGSRAPVAGAERMIKAPRTNQRVGLPLKRGRRGLIAPLATSD
jgi:hypothetical protein